MQRNDIVVDLASGLIEPASVLDVRLVDEAIALVDRHLKRGTWSRREKQEHVWPRLASLKAHAEGLKLRARRRVDRRRGVLCGVA
jgi:hypothetical protein